MKARELAKMALNAKGWEDVIPYRGFVEQGVEEDEYDFETWTMLAPEGTYTGTDTEGRPVKEVLNGEAFAKIAAEYSEDEAYIDKDHESMKAPLDRDTKAYGWIKELKALTGAAPSYNGLYARIKWTDKGRELVKSRAYRFMSPTFELDESGAPVRLLNSALTNRPNFSLPPIINSETEHKETTVMEHAIDLDALREQIVEECMKRINIVHPEKSATETAETATEETTETKETTETAATDSAKAETPAEPATTETTEPAPAATEAANTEATERSESANASSEQPKEPATEQPVEEVIKPEALNSAAETAPTVTGAMAKMEEWRKLKGEDLMQWCRRNPGYLA